MRPGCHFRRTELFKHTSLHCPTRYPLTPGSRECTCEQSVWPRSTTSEHNSAQLGIEPAISRLCKSRTLPLSHDAPRLMKGHERCPKYDVQIFTVEEQLNSVLSYWNSKSRAACLLLYQVECLLLCTLCYKG